jgi:hypothetical protein
MTRAQFEDLVASVRASAEIEQRPVIAGGRPQPFVRVSWRGRSKAWSRPTFRQAFGEAITWLEAIGA